VDLPWTGKYIGNLSRVSFAHALQGAQAERNATQKDSILHHQSDTSKTSAKTSAEEGGGGLGHRFSCFWKKP